MTQDDFRKRAIQWLCNYKRDVLRIEKDGAWLRNGRPYCHILPKEEYQLNILPSIRDEFWKWFISQDIQLHSDFHHLNSSQALCFNLFFPLIMAEGRELPALLAALTIADAPDGLPSFEFQPDINEGTCIDFSLPLRSKARVNFEIKYTESEFGSAKTDRVHLEKYENTYKQRLNGRFEEWFCNASQFLKYYQIARNVWHLNEQNGDIAVFVFPKANGFLKEKEGIIKSCAVEPFRSRIKIWYLEDVINGLEAEFRNKGVAERQYLSEFRMKYLPKDLQGSV
jgi:hypothetical protein